MFRRYIVGPLLTLIVLITHGYLVTTGVLPRSAAGLYLFVLLAGFLGGVRAGLLSAALLTIYNVGFLGPVTMERVFVFISYFIAAAMIGWKTHQWRDALEEALAGAEARRFVDSLNGNIVRIQESRELILGILEADNSLLEATRLTLRSVLHTLNNLQFATKGWAELRELKAQIEKDRSE